MRTWALPLLQCVLCHSALDYEQFSGDDEVLPDGLLSCAGDSCSAWYPEVGGVPRILPHELIEGTITDFIGKYSSRLDRRSDVQIASPGAADELKNLKKHTQTNFGFEWDEYDRFGWDDEVFTMANEEAVFGYKSMLTEREVDGKLVLDAGCGNGRYSQWASEYGARVIGVDISDAVDSAARNTHENLNVQIIQCDIFALPFHEHTFDTVFSIGVLMHTGDAKRAAGSLSGLPRPGGSLTVHLYGKGNPFYEMIDAAIRKRTTRMSVDGLSRFTRRMWRLSRFLQSVRLRGQAQRFMKLDAHPHCIFDWYAAPVATHHTYPEVESWFSAKNLEVQATNRLKNVSKIRETWRSWLGGAPTVTVKWKKMENVRNNRALG